MYNMLSMKDILLGALFILIGLIFFYKYTFYHVGMHYKIGPGYFPLLVSGLLILIGLILIIKRFYGRNR